MHVTEQIIDVSKVKKNKHHKNVNLITFKFTTPFVKTKEQVWRQNKDYMGGATCIPLINNITSVNVP